MVKEMLCELQGKVRQGNMASAWLLTLEPSPMLWGSSGHKESLGVQGRCSNWGEERPAVLAMLFLSIDCEQNKHCLFQLLNFEEIFRKKQIEKWIKKRDNKKHNLDTVEIGFL